MIVDLRAADEHEVVLAFLRSEIDSPRFAPRYAAWLSRHGLFREELIDLADLRDKRANRARIRLLGAARGYRQNSLLFPKFPRSVRWRLMELPIADAGLLKYGKHEGWVAFSGGTRRVLDGARNLDAIPTGPNANEHIWAVAAGVARGVAYPELIAVRGDEADLILLEGHARATAYVFAKAPENIRMFVGTSPKMPNWAFY